MRRCEIYRVRKPHDDPKRYRCYVLVSRQTTIDSGFSTVICAPIHTHGNGYSTQVPVGIEEGLKHDSWVHCDNLVSVHKSLLTQYVGSISGEKVNVLDQSLQIALGLPIPYSGKYARLSN